MACVRRDGGKAEKSQKEIAQAAVVTKVTIRNRYKEMKLVIEEKGLIADNPELSTQTLNDWMSS